MQIWGIHNDEIPAEELVDRGFISVGWDRVGDLRNHGNDREAIQTELRRVYPESKEGAYRTWAGVLRRFAFVLAEGDVVVAADRQNKLINLGRITGPYRYEQGEIHPHRRDVEWLVTGIPRTSFSQPALNEIGSAITLFQVKRHAQEFLTVLADAGHYLSLEADGREVHESPDIGPFRALSDEYLRAIREEDSVFTPGRRVWTLENSQELERAFVDRPDEGGRSFDEKLNDQLAGVSDGALQLFAEVWCLSLAPLADYTTGKKRQPLTEVLVRMSDPVALPPVVEDALETGAFSGGVAFKTRRPFQLALLIRVASLLLSMQEDERAAALSEPHGFDSALASISDPNEPAQRAALRWLLFPDYYLPIVSERHRRAIVDAFHDHLDGHATSRDEELHQIRAGLTEELGADPNFYEPRLLDRWDPDRVLSGEPPSPEHLRVRAEYKTPRFRYATAVIGAIEEGEWATYTDVGSAVGLNPSQVGGYIGDVHHDHGHRVIKIDGTTYTEEEKGALEAEGVDFDERGEADPRRRVSAETLRGRLDAMGVLPQMARRAWLVKGANVAGVDLVPAWLRDGRVTLTASALRKVVPGLDREELKEVVEEDYHHISYAARAEKLDEFHAFLARMEPGHLVVTVEQGRLHAGEITSEASYQASTDTDARLVREVEWYGNTAVEALPGGLAARLKVQRDVLDLTQHLELLEALLEDGVPEAAATDMPTLVLPDATENLAKELHVDRAWLQECIELLRDRPQLIFYGPPGTGKTYVAQKLGEYLAGENVRLVQFHPSYSYEDFFEGLRPTKEGGFELRGGPMRRIVDLALENPSQPYVLIIDEINRGNLAKVFGELYFLLEYREHNVELLYSGEGFFLPANVFIIGTMNTADRSIALVDAAMRRRFAFLPLHPSEPPTSGILRSWLHEHERPRRAADLLDELNRQIADPDFKIGPSYFMRDKVYEAGGLERMWRTSILPLLEEHHFGEMNRSEITARYGVEAIAARVDSDTSEVDDAAPGTH